MMAYFAELDDTNTVLRVISISNDVCGEPTLDFPDTDAAGRAFIANTLKLGGVWKQTSYNGNFRIHFAGTNFTYHADLDAFIPPQPYPSWHLDEETCLWESPVAMPDDDNNYQWNEDENKWVVVVGGIGWTYDADLDEFIAPPEPELVEEAP
jgi:hypothetical protein